MTYIKKAHQAVLHDADKIIERRKDTLNRVETKQYEAFKDFLEEIEDENAKLSEKAVLSTRKYSQSEKGKASNRERQKRFRERQKAKAKEKE